MFFHSFSICSTLCIVPVGLTTSKLLQSPAANKQTNQLNKQKKALTLSRPLLPPKKKKLCPFL